MKRPFTETLKDIRFGELSEELNEAINKVVLAVEDTGKVGELTLTLKLKPSSSGAIEVIDTVKSKIPELPKDSSLFFITTEGNLVRNNPRQMELQERAPIKLVEKEQAHG